MATMTYTVHESLDPYKILAQKKAMETDQLMRFGFKPVLWSRGESVFLIDTPWGYIAFVIEGLGTKCLAADAMAELAQKLEVILGKTFYDQVAQCNTAMTYNDMITLGALPLAYCQYAAVSSGNWFKNEKRSNDLAEGTKQGCVKAGCVWAGGETPGLNGIIMPGTIDLAGGAVGWIAPKERVFSPAKIKHGDVILLIYSSGIHANGLTMARELVTRLPEGYLTKLPDGRTYGETLLDPTFIYVDLIEQCFKRGADIHYAVNVTGHGWRKLMRANRNFAYIIEQLPPPLPIFEFIQERGPMDDKEAYGSLNMGAGFALYTDEVSAGIVLEFLNENEANGSYGGMVGGRIENSEQRKVIIQPKGIEFVAESLAIR